MWCKVSEQTRVRAVHSQRSARRVPRPHWRSPGHTLAGHTSALRAGPLRVQRSAPSQTTPWPGARCWAPAMPDARRPVSEISPVLGNREQTFPLSGRLKSPRNLKRTRHFLNWWSCRPARPETLVPPRMPQGLTKNVWVPRKPRSTPVPRDLGRHGSTGLSVDKIRSADKDVKL